MPPTSEDTLSILLVEDNPGDARLFQEHLREAEARGTSGTRFRMTQAPSLAAALDELARHPYDIVLLDLSLPDVRGLRTLERIHESHPHTPTVVLTGLDDEETALLAVQRGAQDYLVKGQIDGSLLARSIRYAIERARVLEELRRSTEQLRQAHRMEAIGRLAGGVAHDFNNLLTAITGYCDLLISQLPAEDPRSPYALEIRRASDRAAGLVKQLLAFSRRQVMQPEGLDVRALVGNVLPSIRALVGDAVEVRVDLPPDLGPAKADPQQMEHVLLNLALNARDAMPEGGTLTLSASQLNLEEPASAGLPALEPGAYVVLTVSDTGRGMDPDTLSRIFDPFFSTKGPARGTGLGLSTAYGIVRQSGGDIQVESLPGQGTTFRVYLPGRLPGAEVGRQEDAQEPAGKRTVLLVEDEEVVRALVRDLLRLNGYRVLEAGTGHEALDLCQRHAGSLDLAITDLVMPGMQGIEVAERLQEARPQMKILLMSAYAEELLPEGTASLRWPLLDKPFTPDQLALKVHELLGD